MSTKIYGITYTAPHHVPATRSVEFETELARNHSYLLSMPQEANVQFVKELAHKLHGKDNVVSVKLVGVLP